ncbi:MAG: mechanosensitive ion channel domain-containing protein [Bacteroidia bacterium]
MSTDNVVTTDVHQELTFVETYTKRATEFAINYGPKIVIGLIVLVVGFWLINKLTKLSERSMHRKNIDVSLSSFLRSLISIVLKVLLLITVAEMIGIKSTSLVTVLGAAGLAVGLALQGSLSNFAGGVLILVFKPYKIGDTIEVLGQKGEVREIQIFNTHLITVENKTVILPNGSVSNSLIVNQSKHGTLRSSFFVTVNNSFDSHIVKKMISDILNQDKRVLKTPSTSVSHNKIGGGTYTLQVTFFTIEGDSSHTLSDLIESVNNELIKQKIGESNMPEMIVHLDAKEKTNTDKNTAV